MKKHAPADVTDAFDAVPFDSDGVLADSERITSEMLVSLGSFQRNACADSLGVAQSQDELPPLTHQRGLKRTCPPDEDLGETEPYELELRFKRPGRPSISPSPSH